MRKLIYGGVALLIAAGGAGSLDVPSASAAGGSTVLHRFAKFEWQRFYSPTGAERANPANLAPGGSIEFADVEYVGTSKHHAKTPIGSDHVLCVLNAQGNPVCHGQVSSGSSMILVSGAVNPTATTMLSVYDCTGVYDGVTGSLTAVNLNPNSMTSNSNITITLDH